MTKLKKPKFPIGSRSLFFNDMKRHTLLTITFLLFLFSIGSVPTQAQTTSPTDGLTAREEVEGKEVWEKLQAKQLECKNLTDNNFETLGEYFMGQTVGDSHKAVNTMMERMMGKEGEEQMHVVMGKRLSGCESNAQIPQGGIGFMQMMWMMGSAFAPESFGGTRGGGNPMMGYGGWNGFGLLGWLSMLLFWILLILGVVVLVRYLGGTTKGSNKERSPLDILKERYAKGEIDKKEFEQMKKDLA